MILVLRNYYSIFTYIGMGSKKICPLFYQVSVEEDELFNNSRVAEVMILKNDLKSESTCYDYI